MEEKGKRVCVTGAGGYIASWLVKLLLSEGYFVHGTVRDPDDEKNAHLMKLDKASTNLRLFKADLLDLDSVAAAIAGCGGVFHVASPVPFTKLPDPEVQLIAPAMSGTLNVLKACSESAGGVKRVVVVSSVGAVFMNPAWPRDKIMDETSWSDKEYCKKIENWYCLSKTMAESEAHKYADEHGLDVVTLCPSLVIGPLLQSTINTSSLVLINLLKGSSESMENRVWIYVDVRDVADALLLLYEKPQASGRYICAPHLMKNSDVINMLRSLYPNNNNNNYPNNFVEVDEQAHPMSSEKLKMLGWKHRTLEESLMDSMEYYQAAGLLNRN